MCQLCDDGGENGHEPASAQSRSTAGLGLLPRIEAHIRQLSPHMMQRDGVVLLREAQGEIERLRAALVECEHQTHSMRVWGGQSWTYHPPQAGKIAKFARAALDVPNV